MRVVLDTNVIIAGLRSQHGASRLWLDAAMRKRHTLVVSVPLVMEYEAVALRPEHVAAFRLTPVEIGEFFEDLCAVAERTSLRYRLKPVLKDPSDEMVLETAVMAGADAIVTFNVRDFGPAPHFKMPVLTPAAAWTTLTA
jgi:putative PIN family toxin of toxin-antitoxin system